MYFEFFHLESLCHLHASFYYLHHQSPPFHSISAHRNSHSAWCSPHKNEYFLCLLWENVCLDPLHIF